MVGAKARIVTSCFGARYAAMAPAWCRMVRRVSDLPITILALDGATFAVDVPDVCVIPYSGLTNLAWGSADAPRTAYILDQLAAGISCVQIDMDIYLKAPIDALFELPYDFSISRSFGVLPREMVEAHGFEMCSGFYLVTPAGAPFLQSVLDGMEKGEEHVEQLDQYVTNMLLIDQSWQHDVKGVDHAPGSASYSICEWHGVRICVLDSRDIGRDYDVKSTRYGNHGGRFCWLYEHDVLPESTRGRAYISYQRCKYPWVMRRRRLVRGVMRRPLAIRVHRFVRSHSTRAI